MAINSGFHWFMDNKRITGIHLFLILFLFLIPELSSNAQEKIDLSNPYQTLSAYFLNVRNDNYKPEIAAEAFQQDGIGKKEAEEAARKLKQILDGQGVTVNMNEVPRDNDYLDSLSSKHKYVIIKKYPDIFLEKNGSNWIFSKVSVTRILELHKEVFPLGINWLENILPHFGGFSVMGFYAWQLEAILLVIILSYLLYLFLAYFLQRIFSAILNRMGQRGLAIGLLKPIARPTGLLVIILLIMVIVPSLQLKVFLNKYLLLILKAIWPVFVTVIFYRLVDVLAAYMKKMAAKTISTLDDQLVPLVTKILKAIVIITGVLFILININISVLPFITGLSIGGLALALAAQDTIKNFFGSLMIFIDKPFQVGHWITSGEIDGEVEEVGFRSTRVRTFTNSVVYVPNGKLADSVIDNHGLRVWRRFYTTLTITYDTPTALIRVFMEGLNRIVKEHPGIRQDQFYISLYDLGEHSIEIMFYVFFNAPTRSDELKYRQEIIISILDLAEKLNVRFAFPTQTLHLESFPEKAPLTPVHDQKEETHRKKLDEFFGKS